MTDDEFDDDGFDPSEDTDPTVRRLEAELVRLNADLDQLAAEFREQKEEQARIRAQLAEVEQAIARIEARRKRERWLLPLMMVFWGAVGSVLANLLIPL